MPKKVLIALPPPMLLEVDQIAITEHRSRSDLIREALRRYIEEFKKKLYAQTKFRTLESPQPELELISPEGNGLLV